MDFIDIIGTFYDNSINHIVALTEHIKDLRLNKTLADINENIYQKLENIQDNQNKAKGYYSSFNLLQELNSNPLIGDWAVVQIEDKQFIALCELEGEWILTDKEYKEDINLVEYPKKADLKTINNQSIIGEGNIEFKIEDIYNSSSELDGLMSKESYISLQEIKNTIIPKIENDIENLQSILSDDTNVSYIIEKYNQIKEFIESLGNEDEDILNFIISKLDSLLNTIEEETVRAQTEEQSLKERLRVLESKLSILEHNPSGGDSIKHKFITLALYDALERFEKNTLYFIVNSIDSSYSVFGDTFPFILGGNLNASLFGDTFPFILGGGPTLLGGKFPIILD